MKPQAVSETENQLAEMQNIFLYVAKNGDLRIKDVSAKRFMDNLQKELAQAKAEERERILSAFDRELGRKNGLSRIEIRLIQSQMTPKNMQASATLSAPEKEI